MWINFDELELSVELLGGVRFEYFDICVELCMIYVYVVLWVF